MIVRSHHSHYSASAVVLAAVAFLFAARWWEHHTPSSKRTETLRCIFRSVAGLKPGAEVRLNGIAVGTVRRLDETRQGALVTMAISPATDLRRTDEASINAGVGTLRGGAVEILSSGPADAPRWQECDIHRGRPGLDVEALSRRADAVLLDLEGFSRTATRILNAQQGAVSAVLSATTTMEHELGAMAYENRAAVREGLAGLRDAIVRLNAAGTVDALAQVADNVAALTAEVRRQLPRAEAAVSAGAARITSAASWAGEQILHARKAATRLKLGARSTTLLEAHGRRLESDAAVTATLDNKTTAILGWEGGPRGGLDALVSKPLGDLGEWHSGTIRGAIGAGVSLHAGRLELGGDVYRLPDPSVRLEARLRATDRWSGVVRWDDVTSSERRELLAGVETKF